MIEGQMRQGIEGLIEDHYALERKIVSAYGVDGYRAVERQNNLVVTLWKVREPLARGSELGTALLGRVERVRRVNLPLGEVLTSGVDARGTVFTTVSDVGGTPISARQTEGAELERRVFGLIRIVESLHQANILSGDLSDASFWCDRSGMVFFQGFLGGLVGQPVGQPPEHQLAFIAPELTRGEPLSPAADIYSLGVLIYYLYTRRYPFGDISGEGSYTPVSQWNSTAPFWTGAILERCLAGRASERFADAKALTEAIAKARSGADQSQVPARVERASLVKSEATGPRLFSPVQSGAIQKPAEPAVATTQQRKPIVALAMTAGALAVVVISVMFGIKFARGGGGSVALPVEGAATSLPLPGSDDPSLGQSVRTIAESNLPATEKERELDKLVKSDDPLAHQVLVQNAMRAKSPQERDLSVKAILDRARRLELIRSAEQVRQWLRTLGASEPPNYYPAILRTLDNTLPIDARSAALREAYPGNPAVVLRLAAALALDTGKFEEFRPLMAQLVGDSTKLEDSSKYSTLALILGEPELGLIFSDDVIQRSAKLSNTDITWLIKVLNERGDGNVKFLASLAAERGLVSPLRKTFLELMNAEDNVPGDVSAALIKASCGILTRDDLSTFSRWYSENAEKVLLGIVADDYPADMRNDAFEILAGKSIVVQPAGTLIDWIRRNAWDRRADFSQAAGLLALSDHISDADVDRAVSVFGPSLTDTKLLNAIVQVRDPRVMKVVLSKFGKNLSLAALLRLLENADKEVRIGALRILEAESNVGAITVIIEHYEREKDSDVRAAYENLWYIKQRKTR